MNKNAFLSTVFVFGSNLAGRHGAGSALRAKQFYGAKVGVGEGRTGQAYGIPTKDEHLNVLPLEAIQSSVDRFKAYARANQDLTFEIVPIGCGFAGYRPSQIAPMFKDCPDNCMLPPLFLRQEAFKNE